jgi:GNAT superfamily N-acetyltransferase
MPDTARVLRSEDPAQDELIADGWVIESTSWGARLRVDSAALRTLETLISTRREQGVDVEELAREDAAHIAALETTTFCDYPQTHATYREKLSGAEAAALFDEGRVFGVRQQGALIAVTATEERGDLVETHFTSVHPDHRRQGLATAVKAASVLAHASQGRAWFGTGGAGINAASIAMNQTVGYEITETWHTLVPPPSDSP